jgi:NAD-dependent oxidoreductase involved in siderophore biosynthesis
MASIRITPSLLNQVAARHDSVADEIAVARSAGSDILSAVATHGPIMHQFKAAASEVVARRDAAFAQHEAAHRAAADKLRSTATRFSDQEEVNASELRLD